MAQYDRLSNNNYSESKINIMLHGTLKFIALIIVTNDYFIIIIISNGSDYELFADSNMINYNL